MADQPTNQPPIVNLTVEALQLATTLSSFGIALVGEGQTEFASSIFHAAGLMNEVVATLLAARGQPIAPPPGQDDVTEASSEPLAA